MSTPLTKISSIFAGFTQLEMEEVKVLIICLYVMCFWLCVCLIRMPVCLSYFKGLVFCNVTFSPQHDHPDISRTSWKERRWWWWVITLHHSSYKFLSCHWCLLLSLTTPTLFTSTTHSLLRRLRLSLGCSEQPPFFCFCNSSGRGPLSVVVCCMLALSSSSPLCWQPGGGGGGKLMPPCL